MPVETVFSDVRNAFAWQLCQFDGFVGSSLLVSKTRNVLSKHLKHGGACRSCAHHCSQGARITLPAIRSHAHPFKGPLAVVHL